MRRPGSFERYAFLASAALFLALAPACAGDIAAGDATGVGGAGLDEGASRSTLSSSTAAPEWGAVAAGSRRSCPPAPDGGTSESSGFTGSVRAPLFINAVWTRSGQIWFGDVLFGPIGHIDVPDGVSVNGRFSSRFWPIDRIQVAGSSIVFHSVRGRSGAIHLRGSDLSLGQSDSLPARTYLVGATGTPTGLLFFASNGASIAVTAFPPRSCDEPDGRARVLEEGEFPDQTCASHYARIWADGGRCINIACQNRGGSSHVEAVANSVAEVECARYCQRFSCTYLYTFTRCLHAGCGRNAACPSECPNLDFCQASTPEDDPPKFNCACFSRPDAGS